MKRITLTIILLLSLCPIMLKAQEAATDASAQPKTLFAYPQVPDTITTLQNRTNYIITRFWNNYDLSKPIKDKVLFESTFKDYLDFFKYAHKTVVLTTIKDFMNKVQSNSTNMLDIAEMAERNLYSATAEYWSDEVYLPFIESVVASKKVKNIDKERYKRQIAKIKRNQLGEEAPDFEMTNVNGEKVKLSSLTGELFFIFFNTPDCDDCSIARLRLSTDVKLNNLVKEGKLTIVSVNPAEYSKSWAAEAKSYADNWVIGAAESAADLYDIRMTPSFYILDKDKKILNKNVSLESIKALVN